MISGFLVILMIMSPIVLYLADSKTAEECWKVGRRK